MFTNFLSLTIEGEYGSGQTGNFVSVIPRRFNGQVNIKFVRIHNPMHTTKQMEAMTKIAQANVLYSGQITVATLVMI